LFLFALLLIGFTMSGCTRYAKKNHLKQLEDTKAEALAAEETLKQKQAERQDWEQKLAQKEKERDDKLEEKEIISERLGK
jgi:septal ring factor EnvC (AmiA/AmiB activator)